MQNHTFFDKFKKSLLKEEYPADSESNSSFAQASTASMLHEIRGILQRIVVSSGMEHYVLAKDIAQATGHTLGEVRAALDSLAVPGGTQLKYPFVQGVARMNALYASDADFEALRLGSLVDSVNAALNTPMFFGQPSGCKPGLLTMKAMADQTGIPMGAIRGYYRNGLLKAFKQVQGYPRFKASAIPAALRLFAEEQEGNACSYR